MKLNAMILSFLAMSPPALASSPKGMEIGCENMIRAALASLEGGYILADEQTGAVTTDKDSLAAVEISNVKVISSSCMGPADCDAQNPDQFTYAADIGKKGQGLTGNVVVSYHRGNCWVRKFKLN